MLVSLLAVVVLSLAGGAMVYQKRGGGQLAGQEALLNRGKPHLLITRLRELLPGAGNTPEEKLN